VECGDNLDIRCGDNLPKGRSAIWPGPTRTGRIHTGLRSSRKCRDICDIRSFASSRDALRADSDLRAYWPCHRRDGTAGTPELLPQLPQPGLGTISDDYGPAATCRSMDLAAAAGARANRMSRLWAGDADGGRGPERRRATGPTTTRPPGAGRRVNPGAWDSESSAGQLDAACAGY
jgi:hypothetical protein